MITAKLDFAPFTLQDKALYEDFRSRERLCERGCEFSFANLYLWGRQHFTRLGDQLILFSQFDRRSVYPYPVGAGDKRAALDAVIADAASRGIPCRITGLCETAMQTLQSLYPGRFRFHCDAGSFDYVYDINDLSDLPGKKYHPKRTHLNRFAEAFPHHTVEELDDHNVDAARAMVADWYRTRAEQDPDGDYHMERAALEKALRDYRALAMDGLLLRNGDTVLAVTLGARLCADTFDVQFEKARADASGAYPAINRAFARYLREKYPDLRYLDREEDMGLEGLRRAKQSYHPHHQIKKCWACLLEDGYDY